MVRLKPDHTYEEKPIAYCRSSRDRDSPVRPCPGGARAALERTARQPGEREAALRRASLLAVSRPGRTGRRDRRTTACRPYPCLAGVLALRAPTDGKDDPVHPEDSPPHRTGGVLYL